MTGSNDELRRGRALIDGAVVAHGGARQLDRLTNVQSRLEASTHTDTLTLVFPAIYHRELNYPGSFHGIDAVIGGSGFRTSNRTAWEMEADVVRAMVREYAHDALVILKSRGRRDFVAAHGGRGKLGDLEVEWVRVSFDGATTTLGLDPATGRLLAVTYRGRPGPGPFGKLEVTYSDFREVDGLVLPFTRTATWSGRPLPARTWTTIRTNLTLPGSMFVKP